MQAEDSNSLNLLLEEWFKALDIDNNSAFQTTAFSIFFT